MFKYYYLGLLCLLLFSCSKEEEPANAAPSHFELEDLSFNGTRVNLRWSQADDADKDQVFYNVYLNAELIEGPITNNTVTADLEYNKDYEGVIIATDRNGGTSQLKFNFRSPTSMIILVYDWQGGTVAAIDLYTRKSLWTAYSRDNILSVRKGLVFSAFQTISAHQLLTGDKVWEAQPLERNYGIAYRHLMADDEFLFAKSSDATLVAIDLERREKQWEVSLFDSDYRYAMDRNHLYVPRFSSYGLMCINKVTGETEWNFQLDKAVGGLAPLIEHAPLVHGDHVYFQDNNGRFYSVNKHTGAKNYSIYLGKDSKTAPVWVNGNVIFTAGGEIISLKAESGQINWRYNFGDVSQSSPFEDNSLIYVGAGENLFCLDAMTGELQWKTHLGGFTRSSPIVYEQKVYISSDTANLHCINAISGDLEWELGNPEFSVSSPTLVIGDTEEIIHPSNYGIHY